MTSGWAQRMIVATVSLTLFASFNLAGFFGLPQRTQHLIDQPVIAARSLVIPVLTVTLPLTTADLFQPVTQRGTPQIGVSTSTPVQRSAVAMPTPVPVPVPDK